MGASFSSLGLPDLQDAGFIERILAHISKRLRAS